MNNIAKMRKKLKLQKKDVAAYLGISIEEYSKLEEKLEFVNIEHVVGLMTLFKCSFEEIVPIVYSQKSIDIKRHEINRIKYQPCICDYIDSEGNITLYKYKPFNEYVMSDIFNNQILMSYVKDLNDPFEGLCSFTKNKKDSIGYAKYDSLAIGSFSTVSDNPMMWALYSEGHKGLCYKIKINLESVKNKGYLVGSVKYKEKKPMIKVNNMEEWRNINSEEYYNNLLFIKRKEWESEKEVRIIYQPDHEILLDSQEHLKVTDGKLGHAENPKHFFEDFQFVEIIIGHSMYDSNRIKIESWARQKGIRVSEAYPDLYNAEIKKY